MAKSSISIGVDDATGQPASAPEGPYITDEDDGTRPRKPKRTRAAPGSDRNETRTPRERDPAMDKDLSSRRKGPAQP
ncbi:MAG: hypothetical protein ACJ8FV_23870 [Xanthobacteraceae bacterium]